MDPDVFILENVKGLTNHDSGKTFQVILAYLQQLRQYDIFYDILNTSDYGVPQNRERIFIIGLKKTKFNTRGFKFPSKIPLKTTVRDYLEPQEIQQKDGVHNLTQHKANILIDLLNNDVIDDLDDDWLVNLNVSHYRRSGARKDIVPCLLAGGGGNCVFYLTSIGRRLTPREYLRLQGFPDDFEQGVSDSKMYKQVGNSISSNVLAFLFKEIFMIIK